MTRKDYKALAAAINTAFRATYNDTTFTSAESAASTRYGIRVTVHHMCDALAKDNKAFNRDLFEKVCFTLS